MLRVIGKAKYRMPASIGNPALTQRQHLLTEGETAFGSVSAQLASAADRPDTARERREQCSGFKPTSRATARMIERR